MRKRDVIIILGALCIAAALAIHIMAGNVLATASWGLSFRTEGSAPNGPASAAQLQKYDAAYLGDTTKRCFISPLMPATKTAAPPKFWMC